MTTKAEATRNLKREASAAKTRLLDILRKMESHGLAKDAYQLGNIIARLEDWQNK